METVTLNVTACNIEIVNNIVKVYNGDVSTTDDAIKVDRVQPEKVKNGVYIGGRLLPASDALVNHYGRTTDEGYIHNGVFHFWTDVPNHGNQSHVMDLGDLKIAAINVSRHCKVKVSDGCTSLANNLSVSATGLCTILLGKQSMLNKLDVYASHGTVTGEVLSVCDLNVEAYVCAKVSIACIAKNVNCNVTVNAKLKEAPRVLWSRWCHQDEDDQEHGRSD